MLVKIAAAKAVMIIGGAVFGDVDGQLRQKGVDAEHIEQALGQIDEEERMESAVRAAQKAARGKELSSPADRQKVFAALMRRGYDSASAKRAIAELMSREE